MHFKVEAIIPQRQYENIHISYGTDDLSEKDKIMQMVMDDMKKYHNFIQKNTPEAFYKPKEGMIVTTIEGDITNQFTFTDGQWVHKEMEKK